MRRKRNGWLAVVCVLGLSWGYVHAAGVATDEFSELLDDARHAYQQNHLKLTGARLQQAQTLLRELETERLQAVFPPALKGWSIEAHEDPMAPLASVGVGAVSLTGRAFRKGDAQVRIALINKSSATNMVFDFMLKSFSLQGDQAETVEVGDMKGQLSCEAVTPQKCTLVLTPGTDYLLLAHAENAEKTDLIAYVRAMKWDLLETFR
jgi:hypothetical protein